MRVSSASGRTTPVLPAAGGDWSVTGVLAAVAFLPRLYVAIAWAREPVWDGHYYHYGAERIAAGHGYTEQILVAGEQVVRPWSHYPVGFSALLGGVYAVFGNGPLVAPIVEAVLGALLVLVVHRLARFQLSTPRARTAGLIAALHPGLIGFSALIMSEVLAALLMTAALWVAMARGRRTWGWVAAGGLLGLATLVRPASILAAPLMGLSDRSLGLPALRRGAVVTAVALAVVAPWTVRNCRSLDGCAFVSTNGGWNLAIGAVTTSGRYTTLGADDGCPLATGQVQQDRCWMRKAGQAIQEAPLAWLAKAPAKLGHLYDHESFQIEYLHEADPQAWPEPRRRAGRRLLTWYHRFLLLAAALGVVALPPRSPPWATRLQLALAVAWLGAFLVATLDVQGHPFWLLPALMPLVALGHLPGRPLQGPVGRFALAVVLVTSVTHVVFFGEDRYHLVVTPFLCLLAASALRVPEERAAALGEG